jgi:hypothetical protein
LADSATSTSGTAGSLAGGGNGSILYQSAPNVTSFLSTGTPGQILLAAVGGPVFTNTASIYVGAATSSTNLFGGAAGSIPQQTSGGITSLLALGAAGKILQVSTNTNAVVWGDIDGGTY